VNHHEQDKDQEEEMKTEKLFLASLLVLSVLLSACGATTAPQATNPPAEPTKEAPTVAPATATTAPAAEMPYGLKPGKPYAGQKITILMTGIVPQYQAMINRTPEFTELTGIEVNYEMVDWTALVEKVTTDGVAKAGAFDVYPYMDAWGPGLAPFLLPIDDRMKEAGISWSDFPAAYKAGACYDGVCYGIPLRGHPQLLFYRKDVFDQLGLKPPTTFKELEEVSQIIQEKTDLYGFSICYGTGNAGQNLMTWVPFLWGNGSDIFDENWNPIFNNAAGVEATQRFVDLLLKLKIVPPASTTWGEAQMVDSVRQGESAMVQVWWWVYPSFADPTMTKPEVLNNIAFAPPLGWEGKKTVPYTLSMPIAINKFSKHPDAAWEYIRMMTDPSVEKDRVIDKSDPATSDIVATHMSTLMDPEVNAVNGGIHQVGYESLKNADIMPMIPEWTEISAVIEAALQKCATGAPVKETLDAAAEEVRGIMDRAGYYK
jgi:multiple sugar transport system substrate-binding protein